MVGHDDHFARTLEVDGDPFADHRLYLAQPPIGAMWVPYESAGSKGNGDGHHETTVSRNNRNR